MNLAAAIGLLVLPVLIAGTGSVFGTPEPGSDGRDGKTRILLVPLDDRPPCLQWVELMAPVGGAGIIAPPRELLGRFLDAGDPAGLSEWILDQDLESVDAVIVSLDMLAYGGLVASRIHEVNTDDALDGVRVLETIRERRPDLPVYAFSIIMRLAPTADGTNDAWRVSLARWAERSPQAEEDPAAAEEVAELEERIPDAVLADYRRARARNLEVNRAAVRMAEAGTISALVLGQDDAKPQGVHVADREALLEKVRAAGVGDRVVLQPGADELGMLLLARALRDRVDASPSIRAVYSSRGSREGVAPYEDRPLHETVSLQIAAAGAREVSEDDADLHFFVYASRHEDGVAKPFAESVGRAVREGRRVVVADIDTRGNIQGGDPEFTEALVKSGVFPDLYGYASWNTAANTLGTALPQGILHFLSSGKRDDVVSHAQRRFLFHRLINDYVYQGVIRPDINRNYAREQGMNPMRLEPSQTRRLEKVLHERVSEETERLLRKIDPPMAVSDLRLSLPWGRTFEAEIDFVVPD